MLLEQPIDKGGLDVEARFEVMQAIIKKFPAENILKSNAVWYYVKL